MSEQDVYFIASIFALVGVVGLLAYLGRGKNQKKSEV